MYIYICVYLYIYMGITCFTAPPQCFQVFYMCMFQRCCARFPAVVHVSQKLRTFHKPPNNVRVQLHWGDQTRSPDIYIYILYYTHKSQATICGDFNDGKKLVGGGIN